MKRSVSAFRIYIYNRNDQVIQRFDSFNAAIPITGIFTISNNKFINIKSFIGTMPVYIGIVLKILSDFDLILTEHCFPKIVYIHIGQMFLRKFRFVAQLSHSNYTIKLVNSSTATLDYMRKARTVFCPDFLAQS